MLMSCKTLACLCLCVCLYIYIYLCMCVCVLRAVAFCLWNILVWLYTEPELSQITASTVTHTNTCIRKFHIHTLTHTHTYVKVKYDMLSFIHKWTKHSNDKLCNLTQRKLKQRTRLSKPLCGDEALSSSVCVFVCVCCFGEKKKEAKAQGKACSSLCLCRGLCYCLCRGLCLSHFLCLFLCMCVRVRLWWA